MRIGTCCLTGEGVALYLPHSPKVILHRDLLGHTPLQQKMKDWFWSRGWRGSKGSLRTSVAKLGSTWFAGKNECACGLLTRTLSIHWRTILEGLKFSYAFSSPLSRIAWLSAQTFTSTCNSSRYGCYDSIGTKKVSIFCFSQSKFFILYFTGDILLDLGCKFKLSI